MRLSLDLGLGSVATLNAGGGGVFGPNLAAPGTFDSSIAPWEQMIGDVTATGGRLRIARASGGLGRARLPLIGLTVGATYRMRLDFFKSTINAAVNVTVSASTTTGSIFSGNILAS